MAASMTSFTGLAHQRQERFLGSAAPLLPARRVAASSRLSAVAPSALFTKNKNKSGSKKRPGTKGYDDAYEAPAGVPAFTRRREVFVGRLAMFGFSAALLGEILTGKGPIGQVQQELGLPSTAVELLFLGIIAYSLLGAALPGSPTYSDENQADIKKRPAGTANKPTKNIVSDPKETLGVSSFGFTRGNELFVGRTAQLGFLAAVVGEKITGVGILKQFNFETGIPVGQASIGLLAFISFFFIAAIFTGNFTDDEDQRQF